MKNIIKCVADGHNKKTSLATDTKLSQAYDLISNFLKDTKFYVGNGTDIIGNSIRMDIVGNKNDTLDTKSLSEIATVTKTVIKRNKKFLTVKILKKSLSPKSQEKETKKVNISKDTKTEVKGISPFNNVYDDGHHHQFNDEGYCYYCGVNKRQLMTEEQLKEHYKEKVSKGIIEILTHKIEIDTKQPIEKELEKVFKAYGWKDEYLSYQLRGAIFEINKGVQDNFKWFPDETYLNEKIRKTLSRIQEIRHDNRIKALREQRKSD